RLYGTGRRHQSFLVVTIGTGVGAAVVVDGVVLRGASGGAGEIGHTPVVQDGPRCSCGNAGCLEAVIGEAALVRTARERGIVADEAGMPALLAAADGGDPAAAALFSEAGHLLGRTVAGLVQFVDPELVILLGEGTVAWPHWAFGFEPAFRSALLPLRRGIEIGRASCRERVWGGVAAASVEASSD